MFVYLLLGMNFVSVKQVFLLALIAGVEVCDVTQNAVAENLQLLLL